MKSLRLRVLREVAVTALREYLRTPEAIFWTYGFPLGIALVLGLAFERSGPERSRVAIVDSTPQAESLLRAIHDHGSGLIAAQTIAADEAQQRLANGEFDLLLSGSTARPRLDLDPTRPQAELSRLRVAAAMREAIGFEDVVFPEIVPVERRGQRYIDFLIPGLIGINLLGAGLFGVGQNLVMLRVRYLLRRFAVTPMSRAEFLLGFLLSRGLLSLPAPLVILAFGSLAFGVPFRGGWLLFAVILAVGLIAFSGLGLLLACRARTIESISGLMNLVMLPMWLLGGSFFSNERFPEILQPLVQALPLTHANDAMRACLLHGAGWSEVWLPLTLLLAFGFGCFALALRWFRWNS